MFKCSKHLGLKPELLKIANTDGWLTVVEYILRARNFTGIISFTPHNICTNVGMVLTYIKQ